MSSYPSRDAAAPKRLGRYELIGQLATGGMAEIHLARLAGEGGFEKIVVVKRLLPELVASPAYVAMFLDEGKLVARLDHPNICEVHELGRDGTEYYLAMPFLDGIAVHELVARPRDPDRMAQLRVAAGVIVQACAGLHHAHELRDADGAPAGLVHRDVSPSNLFVTAQGVVKVLDFGVAKVRGGTETEVGTIKGKQQYMAPEQLLGEELDRRCDVFALGIVLFELTTHQRLFKRGSDFLTAKAVLEEPIPRADAVDPAIPKPLADVIARALARDRDARYATAAELAHAIEAAIAIAKPAEIAAAVTSTDELSQMRTRQARVLRAAQTGIAAAQTGIAEAPTTIAEAPTTVAEAPTTVAEAPTTVAEAPTTVAEAPTTAHRAPPTAHRAPPTADRAPPTAHRAPPTADRAPPTAHRAPPEPATSVVRARTSVFAPRRSALSLAIGLVVVAGGAVVFALTRAPASAPVAPVAPVAPAPAAPVASITPDAAPGATPDATLDTTPDAAPGATPAATLGATPDATLDAMPEAPLAAPPLDAADIAMPPVEVVRPPPVEKKQPGLLSIDSTPWATIYVDGAALGVTPIVKRSLPAGRHKLRAVLKDGRTKDLAIDIPAGKLAKPIVLTW